MIYKSYIIQIITISLMITVFVILLQVIAVDKQDSGHGILSHRKSPPGFQEFPVSDIYVDKSVPANMEELEHKELYRLHMTDDLIYTPSFAGHYAVVNIPCGTMCMTFLIIDCKTGKVYTPRLNVETGEDYRIDSKLFITNPSKNMAAIYRDGKPSWLKTNYYIWQEGTFTLIYPIQGNQSIR